MTSWRFRGLILVAWMALLSVAGWFGNRVSPGVDPLANTAAAQGVPSAAVSPGQMALDAAAREKKYLFVLFWKQNDVESQTAWQTLHKTVARYEGRARAAQVNITSAAEKALVDRFGLSRSPMPLVLAIAPNGAITGGFPLKVTEQDVAGAFVSPGTASCLKATQERKLVLLCVQPASARGTPAGVSDFKADPQYGPATEVVTVRADDAAEASLFQRLQLRPNGTVLTALLVPPGNLLGSFEGAVSKQQLVEKLSASQAGGCCPGGKCGPGGCGPK
jgi:hypothetical protein